MLCKSVITIAEATEQDIPVIQNIAHQTWPDTFGKILSPEQISYMLNMMYSTVALRQQMAERKHIFLLANDSERNTTLGFVSYEVNYGGKAKTKIHKLYLLPSSQGKGIGKLLINTVADTAVSHQNDVLSLNVNKNNKAIQFYERQGFEPVQTETIDIGNGFVMDDVVMEKSLVP